MLRRDFVHGTGLVGLTLLAGCGETTEGSDGPATGSINRAETTEPTESPTTASDERDRVEKRDTVRDVGAHYYSWYGAPAHDFRDGQWSLESPSAPVLGNYNSTDPEVIDQHIDWCHKAGISWLNVTWWGPRSHEDDRLRNDLLAHPRADELDWSILYESVGRLGGNTFNMSHPRDRRQFVDDVRYLSETYFHRDVYKRIDGRPVLYVYSAHNFTGDVSGAFADAVEGAGARPYLIAAIGERDPLDSSPIIDVADAVTTYDPYAPREDIDDVFLERTEDAYRSWYLSREYVETEIIPTATPGFNDSQITHTYRDNPVLESTPERYERVAEISRRYAEGPVFVTSFNEWYENTQIEPSEEYDEEYLDITAEVLATAEREPPSIEGDTIILAFDRTVSESELNPDVENSRDLTMLVERMVLRSASGETIEDVDVGDEGNGQLLLLGYYHTERAGSDTFRWFGRNRRTVIHLRGVPSSGSLVLRGRSATEMTVEVLIGGTVRGDGVVSSEYDEYTIEFG